MRSLLLILLLQIPLYSLQAQCRVADMVSGAKTSFDKHYEQDGFSYFKMEFSEKEQTIKKEFLALKGKKYQLLFSISGFEETVRIQMYDSEENLLGGTAVGSDKSLGTLYATKGGVYKIVYQISPSETGVPHEGCIAMLIGVSEK